MSAKFISATGLCQITMACVKIYLCSNPEDSVVERKALRENVFPKLRNYCRRKFGVDFRVIDPYEGTDPGTWPSRQERLQLVEECRQNSLGPFFVALLGEKYGAPCLPEQVELSEFLTLLQVCQQMGFRTSVLERCYRRDENTVPPSFCLVSQHMFNEHHAKPHTMENNNFLDALTMAGKILNEVVSLCVKEGKIDKEKADKYFNSSLDTELRFALEASSTADIRRSLCYIHKTSIEAEQKKKNKPNSIEEQQSERLLQLRDDFLPSLVRAHQALVYTTTESDNMVSYAEELGHQLDLNLKNLIDSTVVRDTHQTHDSLSQQKSLCCELSRLYRIERAEVSHIKVYLEQDAVHPFVLTGGPCTGKTVLMAHCANQIKMWLKDQDPVVIMYFTDHKTSLEQVLSSICHQMSLYQNQPYSSCRKDLSQLKETFINLLTTKSSNPLVLILDGLDQLTSTDAPLEWTWLPKTLPCHVKLLISSTPKKSGLLSALKTSYPESSHFFDLEELDSKNCNQMLTHLLLQNNRRITSGQQLYVNQAFKKCSLPLYVDLLHRQVCKWSSELEITPDTLVPGVHINIGRFLDHLEEKHGSLLVSRTLQYLTLSRCGLTEAEVTDILSCDDEVLLTFLSEEDCAPYKFRVPEVVVERLLLDLKGFLITRNTSGAQTLFWVSRHFNLVICKRYLASGVRDKMHSILENYFSGRWSYGTAKPMIITSPSLKTPSQQEKHKFLPMKLYTDRRVPGQPWMFQPFASNLHNSISSEYARPNLRKLQELPFHLFESGKIQELGHMMMSQEFLQAMFQAKLADELVLWLEKASQNVFTQELTLLASTLKTSFCLLEENPADLSLVLQAKLFPFMHVYRELEEHINKDAHHSTLRSFEGNTVLFPTPPVPDTHWILPAGEETFITKAAVCELGFVLVIQNNGSAWIWNRRTCEGFKFPQSPELKFTDVRCSENVFLLFTQSGNLLLWDINAPPHLHELHTQAAEQAGSILVSDDKILAASKESSFVHVFVEDMEIASLQCPYAVTCMASSEDGQIICCGQKEGNVSIFDLQSVQPLASFACSSGISLFDLIFNESEETLTCVDHTGSVFVWDLKTITMPLLWKEKHSSNQEEVLSLNFTESNTLLLCKRQQIQIITLPWFDVDDLFNAPEGKAFVQAVLDNDGHFIIALLENCPFLLVFNCISGQCVLKIDTKSPQAFKLVKFRDTILTAITSTGIVNWDIDLISVAASTAKFGKRVTQVIVDSDGEHFYTADGSELVWRWTLVDGRVVCYLQHHGAVENMAVSADGMHIVAIASGDIYVWNSSTNENIHRICGSQASQILITPKGNIAVSLSNTGPSRVWKLYTGHVICSIHHHLKDAIISPESTFLLGIHRGELLAVSLWFGYISKCFSCSDCSEVVAFQPLLHHQDYVIVITSSGALYSWKLTEETICHQFQFPESFQCPPCLFKLSVDGGYGIISIIGSTINILDIYSGRLCTLNTEGPIHQSLADITGKYAVYICSPSGQGQNCSCDLLSKHLLVALRVTDGKRVGKFYLCKRPSALALSEKLCVYVGFEDGSLGVYAVNDTEIGYTNFRAKYLSTGQQCPFDEPAVSFSLAKPNITWEEFAPELL